MLLVSLRSTAKSEPTTNESSGTDRRIESNRLERALTADTTVRDHGPYQYLVRRNDHDEHLVDVMTGVCDCADAHFCEVVCTHLAQTCVHHAFTPARNTHLVARVLHRTTRVGCPHDIHGCAGPAKSGLRGYLCPGCMEATGCDDWAIWTTLYGRTTE